MIVKPPSGWDRESDAVAAARRVGDLTRAGVRNAPRLLYLARSVLLGFFTLIWGFAALGCGLSGNLPFALLIAAFTCAAAFGARRDYRLAREA